MTGGVQLWLKIGLPPVQLLGDAELVILVCCPFDEQVLQSEYAHEEQVGGVYTQDCVVAGAVTPPSQFTILLHVRVCTPFTEQPDQSLQDHELLLHKGNAIVIGNKLLQ